MAETPHDEEVLGKAFELRLARRLFALARPYRRYVVGSVAMLLLESLTQLAGPLLMAAAIDLLLTRGATGAGPAARGVDGFFRLFGIDLRAGHGVEWIAALWVLTAVLAFVFMMVMVFWTSQMGQGVMFDLRTRIFSHLQRADIAVFDRTPVGRLMTRLTTDVDALNELFTSGFVALLGDVAALAGIVAVLFALDTSLAAITFAILLPMLWVTNWFRKGARDTYRDVRVKIARVNAFLQEHISGMNVVQLFRHEPVSRQRFAEVNDAHRQANLDSIFYYSVFYPALDFLSAVGMASIVWYGGGEVVRGRMTLGAVVAFLQYSKRFYRPLMDLSEKYNILQAAMASSERIFQLLDAQAAVTAPADPVAPKGPLVGDVAFEDVRFSYKKGEEILKGVSFHVPPGRTVALVGATGAGKTTVLNLLLRFYDVTEGQVLVDGTDVRRYDPVRLREHFGIVLQDTFLFTGTIAENVSFFDPDMPRAKIEEACIEVGLAPLLARVPGGLDAKLSERGGGLSVGEKQLVAFARALARDPRVLILDEATSSVDPETEKTIERAVARVLSGRTSIVVAHRLSTIVRADEILVLSHGEVKESGTHAELLAKDGLYARLYALQLKDREAAA
ncbi:MAG TPA: ABC transporter ATP-binding protein [Thermoanaerobaculia bacterium]|nr:ABC transporter ATP-binding protein [Thermoanaerobaculia bacterium]